MENEQTFLSDLQNDLEAAKKAVRYFESLNGATKALLELTDHNLKHAQLVLDEVEAELNQRNYEK